MDLLYPRKGVLGTYSTPGRGYWGPILPSARGYFEKYSARYFQKLSELEFP